MFGQLDDRFSRNTVATAGRARPDAVTGLTVYVALLLAIPSDRFVGPLGGAGNPASIFAIGLLLWWLWFRIQKHAITRFSSAVTFCFAAFVVSIVVSQVVGAMSAMPQTDRNGADMGLLRLASYAGVLLVAADGIQSRERLATLCRHIVLLVGLFAAVGAIQFFSGHAIVDRIPLFGLDGSGGGVDERAGFVRPRSTSRHALEYAAVLSMVLPLAVTLGLVERNRKPLFRTLPVALIALASVLSLTRSALIGMIVGILVLLPFWGPRVRRTAALTVLGGLSALVVAVPGLMGTILNMFSGADSSTQSRTNSWGMAFDVFQQNPTFGRGFGTFLPSYRILDNQYLLSLVETGVLGFLALLAMIAAAVYCAFAGRRKWDDGIHRQLGVALAAAVLAGASLLAFFDAFSFPQAPGMFFLMLGLCGAYWRLSGVRVSRFRSRPGTRAQRRRVRLRASSAAAVIIALAVPGAIQIIRTPGVYWMQQDVIFMPPASAAGGNSVRSDARNLVPYAALVERAYNGERAQDVVQTVSAPIFGTGLKQGSLAYLPNAGGQWQSNFNRAAISVEVVSPTAPGVVSKLNATTARLQNLAVEPQEAFNVKTSARILTRVYPSDVAPQYIAPRTKQALLLYLLLVAAMAVAAYEAARRTWVVGISTRNQSRPSGSQ